jgi:hypothetical protein
MVVYMAVAQSFLLASFVFSALQVFVILGGVAVLQVFYVVDIAGGQPIKKISYKCAKSVNTLFAVSQCVKPINVLFFDCLIVLVHR